MVSISFTSTELICLYKLKMMDTASAVSAAATAIIKMENSTPCKTSGYMYLDDHYKIDHGGVEDQFN